MKEKQEVENKNNKRSDVGDGYNLHWQKQAFQQNISTKQFNKTFQQIISTKLDHNSSTKQFPTHLFSIPSSSDACRWSIDSFVEFPAIPPKNTHETKSYPEKVKT